ncbi:MAG: hypothetical protein ACI4E3_08595 [Candidatus Fimousia sp.]
MENAPKGNICTLNCPLDELAILQLGLEDAKDEMIRMGELNAAKKELEKATGEKPVTQKMFRVV